MTRAPRGVTLIEIVVVIALMAIVASVSAPAFNAFEHGHDAPSVDPVTTLLRRARATALERGHAVTVTIDPATRRFWLDVPDTSGLLELPPNVTLFSPQARVHERFEPNGEATADPLFVRTGTRSIPVIVDRWSGEVTADAR